MRKTPILLALAILSIASPAMAQGRGCLIPRSLPRPALESPPRGQAKRVPVRGNTLALSWSPQFCREHAGDRRHAGQCAASGQFGFILHGLWPEGEGASAPAWCAAATVLPQAIIERHFCMTPSVQLLQHEWQKHGTCATRDPERYFAAASLLYSAFKWPDMNRLSYERPSVAAFAEAFAGANPGLPAASVLVQTTNGGWLKEVKICLDTGYKPRVCPRGKRGTDPRMKIRIWRENPKQTAVFSRR
jgi:ribonuclease T2